MNSPSSSSLSSSPDSLISLKNCQVCGQGAHGKHFGAITCRACAAFFRRCGTTNNFKPCRRAKNCEFLKNGWFNCKPCRLQRCRDVGMTIDNFQFDRDTFCPRKARVAFENFHNQLPQTMGTYLGRPNLILFCAPDFHDGYDPKCYIDVQFLVDTAAEVLKKGSEIPIRAPNSLEKLALGLQAIRGFQMREMKIVTKIGKDETLALWQNDILKVAKWLTYFDEFQKLPHGLQVDILNGIWKVWSRLENVAVTAIGRRQKICDEKMIMAYVEKEQLVCDLLKVEVDLTWCSRFTLDQLKFFGDHDAEERTEDLIQAMMDLQPTDVELSYMMCQLCFHYVGKRYQGVIMEIAERFQESLSNDLHDYYVNRMNMPQYSMRVAQMMKINNHIQKDIYRGRVKSELAKVFDVFYIEFSHPEVFLDM
uniref:Nuclear receptor domain-containing protein n=1 Tax=Caenorhabditis tropicalis TaxID=1561998 RepID=A0A1I7T1M2_9PELO